MKEAQTKNNRCKNILKNYSESSPKSRRKQIKIIQLKCNESNPKPRTINAKIYKKNYSKSSLRSRGKRIKII